MIEPFDLDTMEAAIAAWLVPAVVPTFLFAKQAVSQPSYPYASALLTSNAKESDSRDERLYSTDLTRAKTIRVTPTVQDEADYTLDLDDETATYTSDVDATAAEITAGLVNFSDAWTVTDNGGTLDIERVDGALFTVVMSGNLTRANLDNGHETEELVTGPRVLTYQIAFHVAGAEVTSAGAMMLAEKARTSLGQSSVLEQLRTAGLAVIREIGVNDAGLVINGEWLDRAVLDVQFRATVNMASYTGFIASVEINDEVVALSDEDLVP